MTMNITGSYWTGLMRLIPPSHSWHLSLQRMSSVV